MDTNQFQAMYDQMNTIIGPFADRLRDHTGFPGTGTSPLIVFDSAAAPGVMAWQLMARLSEEDRARLDMTLGDISEMMVEGTTRRIEKEGWQKMLRASKVDAMATKLPDNHFTHVFFNFGPQLVSDGMATMRENYRILRPGGLLALNCWKQGGWYTDYQEALAADTTFPPFPSNEECCRAFSDAPEGWDSVDEVKAHFETAGFEDVKATDEENTTRLSVQDVEKFTPMILGLMVGKYWSKEQVEKFLEPAKEAIMRFIREKYGGGAVVWRWSAVAASGRKPANVA